MPESHYDKEFPNLRKRGFTRTSEPDCFNCIAFAIGDTNHWWWPSDDADPLSRNYWPNDVPDDTLISTFILVFSKHGFVVCDSSSYEPGYTKVALYAIGNNVQHAALQQHNGKWKSKLGLHEDIEHTLDGLEGPEYGKVAAFLKKPAEGTNVDPKPSWFSRLISRLFGRK
jgi:hypothetical protein